MPNTAFSKAFVEVTEGMGTATKTAIVGNFAVNLILSGAMNLLWGLLHAMQILAYLPLFNVMMPANAQYMFKIIIKIANFELIDIESFIEDVERSTGL